MPDDVLTSPGRLAAIAAGALLEPGAVPALDRIVQAAARLLQTPVAQLNVVTADAQVPVSFVGDAVWGRSVGMDRSVCRHSVRRGEPVVVEDAREGQPEDIAADVAELGIVAYLAVPVYARGAAAPIATLCVADVRRRAWQESDLATLSDLAMWAQSEIELRSAELRAPRGGGEEALRAAEARLQLALDAAKLGDWELDLRTRQSPLRSLRHDRIFGYEEPVAEWSYERFIEHVHPEDRAEVDRRFRGAIEKREAWDFECRIHRADGEPRWIWARGRIHNDAAGEPARAIGLVMDITERKQADVEREELLHAERAARSEAEAANRAKSQFLAVMSHELRTPLNAISGYAEILDLGIHGPVTDAQRTALSRIKLSQQHLLGLINEVLSYARLESGSVEYDITDVPLAAVLSAVAQLLEPQTRARGLNLAVGHCADDVAVRADREKLKQILLNLLGNAIKFTDDGGRVDVTCDAHDGFVHIVVRDTGIGISADQLETIFEPFVQGHAGLTRTAQGTGLGLAISRDLAHGMGGMLAAESEPGVGSAFTLVLPEVPRAQVAAAG